MDVSLGHASPGMSPSSSMVRRRRGVVRRGGASAAHVSHGMVRRRTSNATTSATAGTVLRGMTLHIFGRCRTTRWRFVVGIIIVVRSGSRIVGTTTSTATTPTPGGRAHGCVGGGAVYLLIPHVGLREMGKKCHKTRQILRQDGRHHGYYHAGYNANE